jgi:hypothetical protein
MEHGEDEPWTQLATRIPKALHRDLKLHCVRSETSVMDFVTAALREKLAGSSARPVATKLKPYRRKAGRRLQSSAPARGVAAPR